jgi:hypothetical protein
LGTAANPLARLQAIRTACSNVKDALREIMRGDEQPMNDRYKREVGRLQALLGFCPGDAAETETWRRVITAVERENTDDIKAPPLMKGDARTKELGSTPRPTPSYFPQGQRHGPVH